MKKSNLAIPRSTTSSEIDRLFPVHAAAGNRYPKAGMAMVNL